MGKGLKSGASKSASHQLFKDRAKNRVDDLQGMFSDLQVARKESRNVEVALLEEQLHQMLREWKAELNEPSPASSLQQDGSLGSFSSEIYRLLHLCDVEDDATSVLAAPIPEPDTHKVESFSIHENIPPTSHVSHVQPEGSIPLVDNCKDSQSGINMGSESINNMSNGTHFDYQSFNFAQDVSSQPSAQDLEQIYFPEFDDPNFFTDHGLPQVSPYPQDVSPPPSAFLGAKCALWDCPRPARVWCQKFQDYCSDYHQGIAPSEGCPGMTPVLRPGGIGVNDSLLFAALSSKAEGKDVGIPECEGAATTKSPWNAPELFDINVLEGETIREWLFFDKPKRAFESGNRKQRSLPDYEGRGWHESSKKAMYGGLKRSYYMDPQPTKIYEWHLFEYEITKYDTCALYKLELKFSDKKKSPKGKVTTPADSVADLQKQMGRLTAEFQPDNKRAPKGRRKASVKEDVENVQLTPLSNAVPTTGEFDFASNAPCDYLIDSPNGYYLTPKNISDAC